MSESDEVGKTNGRWQGHPYRVTFRYTTSSISGTVEADGEYFKSEAEAIARYIEVKGGKGHSDHQQVDRSSVTLSKIESWKQLLP